MVWVYAIINKSPNEIFVCLTMVLSCCVSQGQAQSEGKSFASLLLPGNAQLSALGGVNVSLSNHDVNFFQYNPSLATDTLNGWASASHLFYFAGIGLSNFSYQHQFKHLGSLAFTFQHLSLGSIDGYDPSGNPTQVFKSGESMVLIGKSHRVNNFRIGLNAKGVFSNLAGYRATAILFDIGGTFTHPFKDLNVGLSIKNFGFVLNEFTPSGSLRLPFDVQAGISYKPAHMPIRASLTAYNLTNFNIAYVDTLNGRPAPSTLNQVAQHAVIGIEVLLHKNVNILLGYNFLRHYELKLEAAGGASGFSMGAKVMVKNLIFSFSRSGYVSVGAWQVSLSVDTNRILRKRMI